MANDAKFDVTKLSDDQLKVATKVVEACSAVGINPDFVLPMVWVESRFNPKVPNSSAGAIGVMQLLPSTAKDMGVDPHDLDENILGGCKYIKYLQDLPQVAGDPARAIAAYHDGPNSEFFKTGDVTKISDDGVKYVDIVNRLSNGTIAPIGIAKPGEAPTQEPTSETDVYAAELAKPSPEDEAKSKEFGFTPSAMLGAAPFGAGVGAAAGSYQMLQPAAQGVLSALSSMGQPQAPTPGGLPPAQGPVARTPLGGQGTFNYAKQFGLSDFDAARAADMSKAPGGAWDVSKQVAEAERKIGPGWKMTPERADLMLPESAGGGPRGRIKAPIPQVQPPRAPLGQRVAGVMARHPVITGTLGGAGAAAQAAEAAERYRTGNIPGAAVMGTGALGSAATMFPRILPAAGPVGLAASIAAPVITGIMDYTRNRNVTPASISADLMRDLKQWEMQYKANIEKNRSAPGGFSLPVMQ